MYPSALHCSASNRADVGLHASRPLWLVRETAAGYEGEGSEHRTLGSVSVTSDAHWTATLTVPIPERQVAFLELERRGPLPAGYRGSDEAAHFSVPLGEVDAIAALLTGIVADARRDRVLPPRPVDARQG
jgi:hypothetical protein